MSSLFVPPSLPSALPVPQPQPEPSAPVAPPDDVMAPKDRRRAWLVEGFQGTAAALGVLGFNLESSHEVSQWAMSISFQLALLGGAEFLKIPFAIKSRTAETPARRAGAFAGLMCGTAISAISLYMAGVTAFAPRHAALEQAQVELAIAKQNDAAFQANYRAKSEAVAAAQKLADSDTARSSGASHDYVKARICDRHGRCHNDKKLGANIDDAKATKDADRKALDDAKGELGKLHAGETSKAVLAQEARLLKASSEDLFSRMATELIGDDTSPAVMLWVRRSVAMMCVFAAMAGSLYAFCSVKAPARKVEAPAAAEKTYEAPDTMLADVMAHVRGAVVKLEGQKAKTPAPPSPATRPAARPRGRPRKTSTQAKKPKPNGDARRAPPSTPPPA